MDLSNNANGLCLVKKLLPVCSKDVTKVKRITALMAQHAMVLVQNPYGNYAVQTALEAFDPALVVPILEAHLGKLAQLSMLKFSSNVIEKCLEKADRGLRNRMLHELATSDKLLGKRRLISASLNEEQLWELCGSEGPCTG